MSDPQPLLDVRDLTIGLARNERARPIVDDVSFCISPGEAFGLLGGSGSGKSTTIRALVDLLPPGFRRRRGSIVFDGRELTSVPHREWERIRGKGIAIVPQDSRGSLVPVITVGRQAAAVYRAHHQCDARSAWKATIDMFARVNLPDPERAARSYPHELSGGMAQRVTIAMALLAEASLLIADEPTTGLDVKLQFGVLELLSGLSTTQGTSLLLVSHDLAVIANYTTRVAVMRDGRIVEAGFTSDIFERPMDPYTRALIDSAELEDTGVRVP